MHVKCFLKPTQAEVSRQMHRLTWTAGPAKKAFGPLRPSASFDTVMQSVLQI